MGEALMYSIAVVIFVLVAGPWLALILAPFFAFGILAILPLTVWLSSWLPGIRVLIADDDEVSIAPLLIALSRCGKKVSTHIVPNGSEALRSLRETKYDLVFLDARMPGLAGNEVLSAGDSIAHIKSPVPVLFYTGERSATHNAEHRHFRKFKVLDVLEKSLRYDLLAARVKWQINQLTQKSRLIQ